MYVPGLSRHLFSVTKFAQHGHHAIIQKHGTTLIFGPTKSPVTIAYCSGQHAMASDFSLTIVHPKALTIIYQAIAAETNRRRGYHWNYYMPALVTANVGPCWQLMNTACGRTL